MLLFPEPLDGLTVSQEAEEEIVQSPLAKTEMNWLPASPSTLWVLIVIDGGSTGSSLIGSLHEYTTADSARSTVSTWNNLFKTFLNLYLTLIPKRITRVLDPVVVIVTVVSAAKASNVLV